MWKNVKIQNVSKIEKCVAEFVVWAVELLPYAKMKVKIFEDQDGYFTGQTDIRVKSKFDGSPEGGIGHGATIDETLEDTLNYFMELVQDYQNRLEPEDIEYSEWSDF